MPSSRRIRVGRRQDASRWFADGGRQRRATTVFDVHARSRPDRMALIYDSPSATPRRRYTYAELLTRCRGFAHALSGLGVNTGDQADIHADDTRGGDRHARMRAYRRGAFRGLRGFAARELASRIDDDERWKGVRGFAQVRRQADPDGLMTKKYDLSTLRAVFVAGERSDPSRGAAGTMRKIANGEDYTVTPTIEDATVLTDLTPVILKLVE
ncbi:hypothetical protein ACHAW5_008945 [Stephanodiscus triporus]|uniref:AMP-dependent synthetase/ligase domain-containing protein n=1 Tax=Stephanodiscus triporus TaxID=2934178 RepID=A0ABD3NTP0_9STRA